MEGIATDPRKIRKVAGWPVLTTAQEVQRYLEFASYYRRFIGAFAEPLYRLTAVFKWTTEFQHCPEEQKCRCTTKPVLAYPDYSRPSILDTDVS